MSRQPSLKLSLPNANEADVKLKRAGPCWARAGAGARERARATPGLQAKAMGHGDRARARVRARDGA